MAVSRRSGDAIHPWLPNGGLRPEAVIRVSSQLARNAPESSHCP